MDKLLPREKLLKYGANKLSDDELLSILLGYGSLNEDVFSLSKRIIKEYGFSHLFYMNYEELSNIKGIKEAKATKLLALFEIAKRIAKVEYLNNPLKNPISFYNYIKTDFLFLNYEKVVVVYTNSKLVPIFKKEYSNNSISKVEFPIQQIIKDSLDYKAYGLFLAHNHPSGDYHPSKSDYDVTSSIKLILESLQIIFLDHIIISKNYIYSMEEQKVIPINEFE